MARRNPLPSLWLALQKERAREVGARTDDRAQSSHSAIRSRERRARGNCSFFHYGPPQPFFELTWLALQKARVRENAQRLMTRRKFLSPPLLWLAPQSDHGSAARAETVAFFQYGPPQSFFELTWLALQKARVREVAQRLMTRRKFLSPPPLMARSAIRSRECRARGN